MTKDERQDTATIMAQKLAMSYITASISNGYLEGAWDDMKKLNVLRFDVKQKATLTTDYFDKYEANLKWFFKKSGTKTFGEAVCDDYSVLQEACDKFMMSGIRLSAWKYNNDDNFREDGDYLCRVSGARHVEQMVLHWEQRQWSSYSLTSVSDGWVPLKGGVRVVEVLKRIHKRTDDETQ